LGGEKSLDLGYDGLWVVEPCVVACPGKSNEAKVRIRRRDDLSVRRRSEGIVFGPEE
jgi:hypothetical protein